MSLLISSEWSLWTQETDFFWPKAENGDVAIWMATAADEEMEKKDDNRIVSFNKSYESARNSVSLKAILKKKLFDKHFGRGWTRARFKLDEINPKEFFGLDRDREIAKPRSMIFTTVYDSCTINSL